MRTHSSSKSPVSVARNERAPDRAPIAHASAPKLADGTRRDVNLQHTKSLRIATRCETIDQFISIFQRYCEDTSIFIPNVVRSAGSVTEFTFELEGGRPAFVGVGSVIEELPTKDNRFGRAGVVVALQQLKSSSLSVFERALAARTASLAQGTPSPVRTRKYDVAAVPIPSTVDKAQPRKTVIGLPIVTKAPAPVANAAATAAAAIKVPTFIAPRPTKTVAAVAKGRARTVDGGGDSIPVPIEDGSGWTTGRAESIPEALPEGVGDTTVDVVPFGLLHGLGDQPIVTTPLAAKKPSARLAAVEPAPAPPVVEPETIEAETLVKAKPSEPARAHAEIELAPTEPAFEEPAPLVLPSEPAPDEPRARGQIVAPIVAPMLAIRPARVREEAPAPPPVSLARRSMRWIGACLATAALFAATSAVTLMATEPAWTTPAPHQAATGPTNARNVLQAALDTVQDKSDPPATAEPAPAAEPTAAPQAVEPAPAEAPAQRVAPARPVAPNVRAAAAAVHRRPIARRAPPKPAVPCSTLDCI
jgi:hypothetical protein